MKHHVFWYPAADAQVERWTQESDDPSPIVQAVTAINYNLSNGAHKFGESREENMRIAFVWPLIVEFEVLTDPPTAIVFFVRKMR